MARGLGRPGDLVRVLVRRALHRSAWGHDGVAVLVGLFTGMIVIRIAANVLIAADMTARGGIVNLWQFATAHAVVFVALAAWTAARRVAAVTLSLAGIPAVNRSATGRRFRSRCEVSALFGQPSFWLPLAAGLVLIVIATLERHAESRPWLLLVFPLSLAGTSAAVAAAFARVRIEREHLEIAQLVGILAILAANPDVSSSPGGAIIVVFYRAVPAGLPAAAVLMLLAGLSPIAAGLLLGIYSRAGRLVSGRVPRSALLVWYRRLTGGPWILVFLVTLPVLVSEHLAAGTRRWVASVIGAGTLLWLVGVVGKMDQATSLLNRPIATRRRIRALLPVAATHLVLATLAVVVCLAR